jgi:flagellar motor switch protein FliN/FliY
MADDALRAAQQAVATLKKDASPATQATAAAAPAGAPAPTAAGPAFAGTGPAPVELPAFDRARPNEASKSISLLSDVNLNVKIELGRAHMLVEDVLKLAEGVVVELDKLAGDPVDVYVNDRRVARGEVLVLNDNFCVRINEIVAGAEDAVAGARAR